MDQNENNISRKRTKDVAMVLCMWLRFTYDKDITSNKTVSCCIKSKAIFNLHVPWHLRKLSPDVNSMITFGNQSMLSLGLKILFFMKFLVMYSWILMSVNCLWFRGWATQLDYVNGRINFMWVIRFKLITIKEKILTTCLCLQSLKLVLP